MKLLRNWLLLGWWCALRRHPVGQGSRYWTSDGYEYWAACKCGKVEY